MNTATKEVSASEAKLHFGELLNLCLYGNQEVMIKKHDKPVAVMVSFETWEKNKPKAEPEKPNPIYERVMARKAAWRKANPGKVVPESMQAVALVREARDERIAYWDKWIRQQKKKGKK